MAAMLYSRSKLLQGSAIASEFIGDDCVFRGDPATLTDLIRPGIPGHLATPISTLFKLLRGNL
jgi:hypothetical protein